MSLQMKKRHKSDYHLLVAKNFLTNISQSGTHDDTKLRIFNKSSAKSGIDNEVVEDASIPDKDEKKIGRANHLVMQCQRNLRAYYTEGYYDSMIAAEARSLNRKKPSLFRRFIKIISMDEFFGFRGGSSEAGSRKGSDSSPSEHYGSMVSLETMDYIKPFRTHLPRCNRDYLCDVDTEVPLIVSSNFAYRTEDKRLFRRSRSLLFLGDRRRNHSNCSIEELRPYSFPSGRSEKLEYAFSTLLGKRKPVQPANIFARHSARRDSANRASTCRSHSQDFLDATMYSNHETEDIEWDEVSADPYNPSSLEEVDQIRKTIIRCPGFVGVTYHYLPRSELKSTLNDKFSQKYPNVNLTYSKFKSIKSDVLSLARGCRVDLMTISQAMVFFERIVAKGLISKHNRKIVAGASLLVAVKLNDYKKEAIKKIIQTIVERLRISRKELLALELPLCVGLQFDLYSPAEHILPHYQRYRFSEF